MNLELRCARVLSVRAAVIEHMRWDARNIPSTAKEIASGIGRELSSVRRVLRALVREGGMVHFERHNSRERTYMLVDPGVHGAARLI